jgi:hypothetical protein
MRVFLRRRVVTSKSRNPPQPSCRILIEIARRTRRRSGRGIRHDHTNPYHDQCHPPTEWHRVVALLPPSTLATALQADLAQYPDQATELRRLLVEALKRDFARWDRVRALIASQRGFERVGGTAGRDRRRRENSNGILVPTPPAHHPQTHPWETPARLARGPGDGDWHRLYPAPLPRGPVNSAGERRAARPRARPWGLLATPSSTPSPWQGLDHGVGHSR